MSNLGTNWVWVRNGLFSFNSPRIWNVECCKVVMLSCCRVVLLGCYNGVRWTHVLACAITTILRLGESNLEMESSRPSWGLVSASFLRAQRALDWPGGPLNGPEGQHQISSKGVTNTVRSYFSKLRTKPQAWFGGFEGLSQSPGSRCKIITSQVWFVSFAFFTILSTLHPPEQLSFSSSPPKSALFKSYHRI